MELNKIIGLTVISIRGFSSDKRKYYIDPHYILFSDKKTFIELHKQDYYDYHDCSSLARTIYLRQDSKRWTDIFNDLVCYPEANMDI